MIKSRIWNRVKSENLFVDKIGSKKLDIISVKLGRNVKIKGLLEGKREKEIF